MSGDRLWQAMEAIPDLCGVEAEWRRRLGEEYDAAERFLRPERRLAESYPCPSPVPCGCTHRVVHHGPDDIVGVCRCEPRQCGTHPLKRSDVVLFKVDRLELGKAVAAALGARPEHADVPDVPMTWCIGIYSPYAGFPFPVYQTAQVEPDDFRQVVDALVARAEDAFILVAPTRDMFQAACTEPRRRVRAHLLPLAGDFVLDASGSVLPRRPVEEILAPFLAAVLPAAQDGSSMVFFPTPAGATWEAVQIRFRDRHTVSVRVKDAHGVFHYSQMGMADSRNGEPTRQWQLLEDFAERHGNLDWSSRRAHRSNQKRKEKLAENLRKFFRVEGDPFEVVDGGAGDGKLWRTRFSLDPVG